MNCLPGALVRCAVSGRAKASVPPPAGKGTTMVTGLLGQLLPCASASGLASASAVASSSARRGDGVCDVLFMLSPLFVGVGIYITVCTARERATSPCLNFSWLASILSRSYR